jgi:hypothetical protein
MLRKALEGKKMKGKIGAIKHDSITIEALEECSKTILEHERPAVLAQTPWPYWARIR